MLGETLDHKQDEGSMIPAVYAFTVKARTQGQQSKMVIENLHKQDPT